MWGSAHWLGHPSVCMYLWACVGFGVCMCVSGGGYVSVPVCMCRLSMQMCRDICWTEWERERMCVCVSVLVRVCERDRECVCACVCVNMPVCLFFCLRVCQGMQLKPGQSYRRLTIEWKSMCYRQHQDAYVTLFDQSNMVWSNIMINCNNRDNKYLSWIHTRNQQFVGPFLYHCLSSFLYLFFHKLWTL